MGGQSASAGGSAVEMGPSRDEGVATESRRLIYSKLRPPHSVIFVIGFLGVSPSRAAQDYHNVAIE